MLKLAARLIEALKPDVQNTGRGFKASLKAYIKFRARARALGSCRQPRRIQDLGSLDPGGFKRDWQPRKTENTNLASANTQEGPTQEKHWQLATPAEARRAEGHDEVLPSERLDLEHVIQLGGREMGTRGRRCN